MCSYHSLRVQGQENRTAIESLLTTIEIGYGSTRLAQQGIFNRHTLNVYTYLPAALNSTTLGWMNDYSMYNSYILLQLAST